MTDERWAEATFPKQIVDHLEWLRKNSPFLMELERIRQECPGTFIADGRFNYIPLAEIEARAEAFNRTVRGFTSEDFISSCLLHK